MKRKSSLLIIVGALLSLSLAALAADAKLDSSDEAFLKKAAQGGLTEVKLGEIASTKAKREDVKAFGTTMVKDHSNANADLKTLAAKKAVELPDKLDMKHSAKVDKLSKLEGDAFDGAYVKGMIEDHEATVKEFENAASSAKDADVKAFAAKTLPTLKAHFEHIKTIGGKK
jgi:putative membrane protein